MSAGGRLANRIQMRCLYTGESFRHLKGSLTAIDNERPGTRSGEAFRAETLIMASLETDSISNCVDDPVGPEPLNSACIIGPSPHPE